MNKLLLVILTCGLVLPGSAHAAAGSPRRASRPNVILFMTDDQGYGDLSALGSPILKTPNLDKLYVESVRFTDFHVDPTCSPTRGALMTGKYAHRIRVWHTTTGGNYLRETEVTMADVFKHSGYRTALFGKWHLGANYPYRPMDRGFDEWLGQGDGGTGTTDDYFTNDRVNDMYLHNGEWEHHAGWSPDVFFGAAAEFIRKQDGRQPFFVYLATYVAHSPHTIPDQSLVKKYEGKVPKDTASFYASIEQADRNLGQLRRVLEEIGQADNTLFIFLTDNGGTAGCTVFNAGMKGKKGSPYEGGHRVPLFVHWPAGGLAHGKDVDDLTAHIDILPTLIDLCELKLPKSVDFDGRSFKDQLYRPATKLPERTLAVEVQRTIKPEKWKKATAMRGQWRLVNNEELYDVASDPGQTMNVAAEHAEIVARLRKDFDAYWDHVTPGDRVLPVPIIGSPRQRETRLSSMDWQLDTVPWNHALVAKGPRVNADWQAEIAQAGTYHFEVRRWPREADAPMQGVPHLNKTVDAWENGKGITGLLYGDHFVPLPIRQVRLDIEGQSMTQALKEGQTHATFGLDLPAGKVRIRATLLDADGKELGGAYYLYVKKDEAIGKLPPASSGPEQVQDHRAAADFGHAITLGSASHEDEFPAIGSDDGGNLWVCWVAFDGQADAVLAAKIDGQKALPPVVLSEASGDHWRPAMCKDGKGRLWATWAAGDQGKWDIWGKVLADGKWSDAIRLTRGEGNDFGQKLAVDKAGTLWMTWQSAVNGNYEVLLAAITPDGPGEPLNVSRHPASDWEPAIAAARDGRVYVAWDSYRSGSYDILVAELKNGRLSEPVGIATSPAYEAHAALAVDHQDRLWIAWDNGGVRWGEDNEEGRKLHSERSVEIRCLAHGELAEPAEPLSVALSGPLARFCELPELSVDGSGRLWLFVRHLTDLTPKIMRAGGRPSQDRGIWNPYVLCYDGSRWSQPRQLPDSNGRNDMRVCTCLDRDGRAWAAWADDGRTKARPPEPQNHNIHAVPLSVPGPDKVVLKTRTLGRAPPAPRSQEQSGSASARHKLSVGGREYLLAYGDTHRHTDLSQCGMNRDGSLMDTYRYAIDVAGLDFLAISDHDQDLLKHRAGRAKSPLQHYGWWRSEKYCDLFHIEHKFIPLYAYEHGGSFVQRGGHKNVLYLERGQPCYEEHSPEALFKALEGKNAIAIPHQLADGPSAVDWTKWNPAFERVAEVFQARGSYEYKGALPLVGVSRDGNYYRDALAMGIHIGAIASSDHGMVHSAYAGVYCSELSRAGVMEGLKSRRTFGSMDRMVIEFRLGDRLLGEEVEINASPAFNVLVESPKPLRKIQIVKNGALVHTVNPDALTRRFDYVDRDIQPGQKAWYYVRCEQDDDRYGWSSPIWVEWRPSGTK